ncbi:MAG: SpoIIE family protein phosphatase [Candidatus Eisenbacteria bacterium]
MSPPMRRIQWPRVQWSDLKSKAVRFGLLLAAVAFAFALTTPHIGLFQKLELTTEDIRLRLRGQRPIHPAILTVEIDEGSLRRFHNTWPFARDYYALLFNGLRKAGARVIGVDLLFIGPDINAPAGGGPISNDQLLAAVIGRDPRILNGFYFPLEEADDRNLVAPESLTVDARRRIWQRFTMPLPDGTTLLRATDVPFDLEEQIADASDAVGHVALSQDVDATIRALPLLINQRGRAFPSLSLLMVARYLGADWRGIRFMRGRAFLPYPGGELTVPVERHAEILINYPGPDRVFEPSAVSFDTLMIEIAARDSLEELGLPRPHGLLDRVEGKIVLVCNTATTTAIADFGQTPFAQTFPLAYAHASVINSMLRGDYLSKVPRTVQAVAWALIAFVLAVALAASTPVALALTVLATIGALLVVSWAMVAFGGSIIEVVPPVIMVFVISLGHLLRGYIIRDRQRRAQEQELAVARRIQQDLLPRGVLAAPGLEVVGANRPCFEVGGDYFDYFPLKDGRIALAIADVAGKGVGAALLMSNVQAILRAECARGTAVPQVPAQANRQLMESLAGNSKFVTFFYGALDPVAKRFYYSNAGHNPPLVVRADGRIEELTEGGLILGVFPLAEYDEGTVDLAPGDVLALFTDGVTEAESRQGLYSDERLQELLLRERGRSAKDIAQAILDDVDLFSHGRHQTDDVTVVIVKVT